MAFVSEAALAPRDDNEQSDVYVYDAARASVALVSATAAGPAANAASRRPAVSADARQIVYESVASNLGSAPGCPATAPDTNLLPDIYAFDRLTGCVARISGSSAQEWWTASVAPAIDAGGTVIVFSSSQHVAEDDPSTDFDLFLSRRTR